jgi:hypothetical protein
VGLDENEFEKRKLDTGDDLLARVLGTAARTKKREDKLRRKTREFRTRIAK